jgi:hypothetical protein
VNTSITLNQAVNLVATCGTTNTFIFEGEPGVGKSALRHPIMERLGWEPDRFVYFDAALLDLGDLQMPKVTDSVDFVPNKMLKHDKPVVIMLDEIGKAMRPVQNALLTLLLEHRIGTTKLPEGSIVFGTTNMSTDGVGDVLQAHAKNRVSFLRVRKPDADAWMEWGVNNNVAPEVMAWVKEYPHALESYTEYEGKEVENPYIFNPRKTQTAFVSPRSLAHASHIVQMRAELDDDTLIAALAGTIGESAARDMEAFLNVADSLPSFDSIIEKPDTAKVPDSPIAQTILALGAVMRVDRESINAWMSYIGRLAPEIQFLFVQNAMRSSKSSIVATARNFTLWAQKNSWAV